MKFKGLIRRIEKYLITMSHAKRMLDDDAIQKKDYNKFESKIAKKYKISSNSIYRDKDKLI